MVWPLEFSPHPTTVPSGLRARVWNPPAASCFAIKLATVVACHKTVVAVLSASVLRGMMDDDFEVKATIMTNMSKVLSRRLRTMNERFDDHAKPLAYAR